MGKNEHQRTVVVQIRFSGKNFGAYIPILPGCVATGNNPNEIKQNLYEALELHLESSIEDGDPIDDVFKKKYELIYNFDSVTLLNYYKGLITLTGLEKLTGINQKQLHHYSSGHRKPRKEIRDKIEKALHNFGNELLNIELD